MDNVGNNLAKIPVVSHASGSPSLVLGTSGTQFPAAPFRVTAITGATYGTSGESLTIYGVSAVATNTPTSGQCTLTVSVIEATSDQSYGSSDFAELRLTAGTISDLNTAVAALQSEVNGPPSGVLKGSGGRLVAATAGTDYGTVTSVGLTLPAILTVSGSPVTTSGTLAATLATQAANVVFAGPTTGSAAAPTFRALATADLPTGIPNGNLANASVTVTAGTGLSGGGSVALGSSVGLSIAAGGVGTTQLAAGAVTASKIAPGTANNLIGFDGSGNPASIAAGSGITISGGTIAATTGGGGTVTSVGLTLPAILTVSGSPVTTSGTLAATLATQSANLVFAGPSSGSAAAPTFRALVTADLPTGIPNANLANASVTISGHALSLGGSVSLASSDVGLGSVTNDAQTKSAVVPNTAPSSGQVLVGNAGGTAYAAQSISGSGATFSLSSSGVLTVSAVANASLVNSTITIAGTSTALGGSITLDTITGLSSTGLVKRTAANTLAIATSGTDYAPATSGSAILYGNGSGGFSAVTVGTGLSFTTGTLTATGGGGGSPGGSSGQVQYNSAGSFAGATKVGISSTAALSLTSFSNSSPSDGDVWYDSGQAVTAERVNGMTQRRTGTLYTQSATTASPVSGATLTSLTNDTGAIGTRTLPANFLIKGKAFRIRAAGYFAPNTTAVNLQFQLLLGGVVLADTANNANSFGTTQANTTQRDWYADLIVTYQGSNSVMAMGIVSMIQAGAVPTYTHLGNNGAASTVTATNSNTWDLKGCFSSSIAGQALAMTQFLIEAMN